MDIDTPTAWILAAVVIGAFVVVGLVLAFVADRRRNQEVAHDPERFAPDPNADRDPRPNEARRANPEPGEYPDLPRT